LSYDFNKPVVIPLLFGCPHCDLLQRLPALKPGESARCPRCGEELWRRRFDPYNRPLALAIAAAFLYVIANSVPMLGLTVVGRSASTTIFGGVAHLWQDGRQSVALLVFFTAILAPALQIGFMLPILIAARRTIAPRWVGTMLRYYRIISTWSMMEVMLLGVLVALIKIADYATVIPGTALFVLGTLVFLLAAMQANFDPLDVWSRVEWACNDLKFQPVSIIEPR
jgi:paraquat-inducible protein A